MPRQARVKSKTGIYHIMVRSLSEFDLYRDSQDKMKYLKLIRKYKHKYGFDVYAYCLMDNHAHMIIDCLGADISKIMQVINFCYAQYYNRKYKRRGPVFQDRFKSIAIESERYLINLSAYIHNNPKDIKGYSDNVVAYPFSSLKEYINETNTFKILNTHFLRNILGLCNKENKNNYLNLVCESNCEKNEKDVEFSNVTTEYRSERTIILRDAKPEKIIAYVATYMQQDKRGVHIKYSHSYTRFRALSCFLMSCFSEMTQKEICKIIGNITQSRVSKLSNIGLEITMRENICWKSILQS